MKPVKKEAKKEVEEEPEDKREHLNIIFIGHVGKNFASISVSGQLPNYPSLTQQESIDNKLGLMLG